MAQDDFVGKQIGEFVIRERIGRGGMATVYRAHQTSVNRDVALKVIRLGEALDDGEFRRRFQQEAQVVADLEHIHILPIYSYGLTDDGDTAYIAMRLLRGGSLSDLLKADALPLDRASALFGQICSGLAFAHSRGVIHRDLKPSNIMLDQTGNAFLADFGLAKLISGSSDITKTGNIVGTPAYMSPEQLRGETLDHRSDIYSLGVLLYHMVTGNPPFNAATSDVVTIIYKHLEEAPEPPSTLNPDIPPALEAIILKALQKDPKDRFDTAGEMEVAVKEATGLYSTASHPAVNPSLTQRAADSDLIRRSRTMVAAGRRGQPGAFLAVLVVVVAAVALLWIAQSRERTYPQATVQPNVRGSAIDAVPTDNEIAIARERLGSEGFIAYISCTQDSEFHTTQAREMRDFAVEYGLRLRIYDSENDGYEQITQIERARTDGAVGLIICPLDEELLSAPLESAQEAGIPLVFMSNPANRYGGVVLASENENYQMGQITGEAAGAYIRDELGGEANVIILDFPTMEIIVDRANGLEFGLLEFAPDATVIGRYLGGTQENAYGSVREALTDGVQFDVILSINDAGSFGAIAALEEADIGPDAVAIFSIDAEQLALRHIRDGYYIRATLSLSTGRRQAAMDAVNSMTRLLGGGSIPEMILQEIGSMVTQDTLAQEQAGGQ